LAVVCPDYISTLLCCVVFVGESAFRATVGSGTERVRFDWSTQGRPIKSKGGIMPIKKHGVIIETPGEERQAEPASVLALLAISTALAALILGGLWNVFQG
jgi:hypothetical protein